MAGGRETANEFASAGYSVTPALEGGFIVQKAVPNYMMADMMAFTNSKDLLGFLSVVHTRVDEFPEGFASIAGGKANG